MSKKPSPSEAKNIRFTKDDLAAVKVIQDNLSKPGLDLNFTDAVRRSIHKLASELRARKEDRRKANGS